MANIARLCTVKNLPLHIGTRPGFLKFMRNWEHVKTKREEVSGT